ncbi:unnamed protein product, partial [marine sediment metagenome]
RNIIEVSNSLNESFIVALSIDDKVVGDRLTEFFDMIWEASDHEPALDIINSLKPD